MLHQTLTLPFSPSSLPFPSNHWPPPTPPQPYHNSFKVEKEMEMEMERAEVVDEVAWAVERNSVLGEFSVDDLLDFGECIEAEPEEEEAKGNTGRENSNTPSSTLPSEPPQLVEIISADDVAALEWVSHFVDDDSFSEYNNPVTQIHVENQTERPSVSLKRTARFLSTEATVPAKAKRSKRSRAGRVWFISGPPTISESDSSTTTTTTSSSSSSSCLTHDISDLLWGNPPPTKKQKQKQKKKRGRKPKTPSTASSNGDKPRCTCRHCGVQETPQWRAGPDGPKTLCNACGVRFKSGRLLPEYRPACSPTFVSHVHSNSHRKVLEMRRKNLDPPVPSS